MASFLDKILSTFGKIKDFLVSGKAQKDANLAFKYASEALPYIQIAQKVFDGTLPNSIPAKTLDYLSGILPGLFNGSIKTDTELKSYALQVAQALLVQKYPDMSTTAAILATTMAFSLAATDGTIKTK